MDLRVEQLRRFVVLAEDLNFTRAARRLHLSQQALSAQVRQLETALGTPLLVRTRSTPAGTAARPLDPPLRIPLLLCWQGVPPPALQHLLQHLDPQPHGHRLRDTGGDGTIRP